MIAMKDQFQLANKNIFITGASSGIGQACAIRISEMGANIILLARDGKKLQDTISQMKGSNHLCFSADLTKYERVEEIIDESVSKLGKIDGFINAAGIEQSIPLRNMSASDLRDLYEINVIAAFELARIVSKKKNVNPDAASFIFIASIMGVLGESGKTGYCSSKGGLISGARAIALELAGRNIRVNCLSPAIVETKMTLEMFSKLNDEQISRIRSMHPLGFGKPEDIANLCLFLLSPLSRWMTGSNIIIDGGYSIT